MLSIEFSLLKGNCTHFRYFNILNFLRNHEEQKKPEVIPMFGSRVITILRFLLWRHGGQKAIFPICFHLKSKSSNPDIFTIFYIVEMKLGRSWGQSSNFTKIWILKISVIGSWCFDVTMTSCVLKAYNSISLQRLGRLFWNLKRWLYLE